MSIKVKLQGVFTCTLLLWSYFGCTLTQDLTFDLRRRSDTWVTGY